MKKTKKLFGIIAIIAIIGLLFAGCGDPGDKINDDNNNTGSNGTENNINVKSITITKYPTKMEYLVGESFSGAGMVITATLANDITVPISSGTDGYTVNGFSSEVPGQVTVTITYGGKSASFKIVVYAVFTVTFDKDNGSVSTDIKIKQGDKVTKPSDPSKEAFKGDVSEAGLYYGQPGSFPYRFIAWFTEDNKEWIFDNAVSQDMTLKAKYKNGHEPIDFSGMDGENEIEKSLAYNKENRVMSGYTLYIDRDIDLKPQPALDWTYATHTIVGFGEGERQIKLSEKGNLFTVGIDEDFISPHTINLTIGKNITLVGRSSGGNGNEDNDNPLILIRNGNNNLYGAFEMLDGSKITGNTNNTNNYSGATVYIGHKGKFVMKGGEISGNTSNITNSSIVDVQYTSARLAMSGGKIYNNNSTADVIILPDKLGYYDFCLTLSGNAYIQNIIMSRNDSDNKNKGFITIEPGWISDDPNKTTINLIAYSPNLWEDVMIIGPNNSHTMQPSDIEKFTLGRFYSNNPEFNLLDIETIFKIEDSGENIGKLVRID